MTRPEELRFVYLTNGSTISAIGDYSSAVEQFIFSPVPNRTFVAHRMIVYIEDAGAPDSGFYGNSVVLTNGVSVVVRDAADNLVVDVTGSEPVRTNAQWGALCYDVKTATFGQGNDAVMVRWTFAGGWR